MTIIHHLICGSMHAPPQPQAICHCLLLQDEHGVALVDTGVGLLDVQNPTQRIGQALIDMVGFVFDETRTAARHCERLRIRREDVGHIVLTHADPDHTGGLADFPWAQVHLSVEEHDGLTRGSPRYLPAHFEHGPRWRPCPTTARQWFGLEARPLDLGFTSDVLLIPLFGHTRGHCGVAVQQEERWVLHAGDSYYLRAELTTDDHPVSHLAAQRADDDDLRRASLQTVRRLVRDYPDSIEVFGYHDPTEFPAG